MKDQDLKDVYSYSLKTSLCYGKVNILQAKAPKDKL
jgi:hypothetical protein